MTKFTFLLGVLSVVVCSAVGNVHAATGYWYLPYGGGLVSESNPLEMEFGQYAELDFCIVPDGFVPMNEYFLNFEGDAKTLLDSWVDLLPGAVWDYTDYMPDCVAVIREPCPISPGVLTTLGMVGLTGRRSGTYSLTCEGEIGSQGVSWEYISPFNSALIHVALPDLIPDGLYAPVLEPYTATAWANNDSDWGADDDYVSTHGFIEPMEWGGDVKIIGSHC